MQRIRLLLLDDHALFREGIARLLESESWFEVIAQCGSLSEAVDALAQRTVDVVLLDYDLEMEVGTRFISVARASGYQGKILIVTAGMTDKQRMLAWELGISGIALKHSSPRDLLNAIRTVAAGGIWNADDMITPAARPPAAERYALSPRERQVLRAVLEGQTNHEIATQLGVSLSSVKASLQHLFDKTGVRTRSQLVRVAIERSLETTDLHS